MNGESLEYPNGRSIMNETRSISESILESRIDWARMRADFPILDQKVHGQDLIYLDNAATTQVPRQVTDALVRFYQTDNANVHRGIHTLSERSTKAFENSRKAVSRFINSASPDQVIFTSSTTAAFNTLARLVEPSAAPGDRFLVSALEHHANFVPWQQLAKRTGASFEVIPLDANGEIDLQSLEHMLEDGGVRLVSVAHASNVLGTVSPVRQIARLVHSYDAFLVVDAAQSIRHENVDVSGMDCDFLAFSGHKMCAGGGIGVLYGKSCLLERLEPVDFGGEMVDKVSVDATTFEAPPICFEAGTPNYPGAVALAAAIDYLNSVGRIDIAKREIALTERLLSRLVRIDGVRVFGSPRKRAGCVSFVAEGVHPFDIAAFLDAKGIAVRSGNLCAQPLLREVLGVDYVVRASVAFYNTPEEIDAFGDALEGVLAILVR